MQTLSILGQEKAEDELEKKNLKLTRSKEK